LLDLVGGFSGHNDFMSLLRFLDKALVWRITGLLLNEVVSVGVLV